MTTGALAVAFPAALLTGVAVLLWLPRSPLGALPRERERRREGSALPTLGVAGVVVAGYLMLGGALGVVVGGFAGLLAWKALARLEGRGERQRSVALMRLAPLLADLVAAALAAGRDPGSALRLAAESAGPEAERELAVFSASLALGADPVAVWRDLSRHPQFGAVGRAFVRASETGSSVTEAMKRGAEDLRALDRSEREAAARTVATRAAAPLGVCLLPAFVLVGIVPLVAGAVQQLVL